MRKPDIMKGQLVRQIPTKRRERKRRKILLCSVLKGPRNNHIWREMKASEKESDKKHEEEIHEYHNPNTCQRTIVRKESNTVQKQYICM